jgi:hypothetical protein
VFFKKISVLLTFIGTFAMAGQQRRETLIDSEAERLQETGVNEENPRPVVLNFLSQEQRQPHDRCEHCCGVAYDFGCIKFEFLVVQNPDGPFGKLQRLYHMVQVQPCSCSRRSELVCGIIVTLATEWHQVSSDKIQRLRRNNELYFDWTAQT